LIYMSSPMINRRKSRAVSVGHVTVGGDHPIAIQSMVSAPTMDSAAVIAEVKALVAVGCPIVRITAPTVAAAKQLRLIREGLAGVEVALVADIHFQAAAACEAARYVDKVRINPGNFCEAKGSDLRESFHHLLAICRENGVAVRIGTNHGSLSERMMNAYGDSPRGMVESALEFLRLAREVDFHDIILSMKASNPKVMITAYRMLVEAMDAEGMDYPLHLGVTEAGDGEDGRIKSAIGIGSLLSDGIGDTIRVSLTEDSVHEIPVARELIAAVFHSNGAYQYDALPWPTTYQRRVTREVVVGSMTVGGKSPVRVGAGGAYSHQDTPIEMVLSSKAPQKRGECAYAMRYSDFIAAGKPECVDMVVVAQGDEVQDICTLPQAWGVWWSRDSELSYFDLLKERAVIVVEATSPHDIRAAVADAEVSGWGDVPLCIAPVQEGDSELLIGVIAGAALCDGIGDGILLSLEDGALASRQAYTILQSAGVRLTRADFIACPSCGRTLFDLQETTARVKAATAHLKGVKIAIMGCIVNGPGEMADADFGYVGGAPGKINLYVGKECVRRSIPSDEAVAALLELLKSEGVWVDPV
jgi:(E)-4-hydroxy-3-methylbut-2-enyl-diphosphate synthase